MIFNFIGKSFGRTARLACASVLGLALISCGGGGGSAGTATGTTGTGTTGTGTTTVTAGKVILLFSSPTLPSAGLAAGIVTITAQVEDSNNNALSGVPVTFTADSGILTVTLATTGTGGLATATLNTGGNPTNRVINLTATGGGITAKGTVNVTGTTLTITGAPSALTAGTLTKFQFNLQDSSGNNLPNVPVTFSGPTGYTVATDSVDIGTPSALITDSHGNFTLDVTPAVSTSGSGSLTVAAGGANASPTFTTSSQSLTVSLTDGSTVVSVNPQPKAEYTNNSCIAINAVYSVAGAGQNGTAAVSSSRGTLYLDSACTTLYVPGTNSISFQAPTGAMQPLYLASATAGTATVTISETTGTTAGPSQTAVVTFISQLTSIYPASIVMNASPNVVAPNPTTPATQFSVITATVRDGSPSNNLVAGVPVAFSVKADSSGGSLSVPQVVTTGTNGQAQVNYYPGPVSTTQNGVVISATTNGPVIVSMQTTLTVASQSLFVTLGTGNTMSALDATTYQQPWAVYVTDAAGHGVANATITTTLVATSYSKGQLSFVGGSWGLGTGLPIDGWNLSLTTQPGPWCLNNDNNNSGVWVSTDRPIIVYPTPYQPNPALNGTPYKSVVPGIPGSVTSGVQTDATGHVILNVTYPKDHAIWTNVILTATAATLGSQSTAQVNFTLEGLASDYTSPTQDPPGLTSPYGINACGVAF